MAQNEKIISNALRCPICRAKMRLAPGGRSLLCLGGREHCFDISAAGYVNLSDPKQSGGGDSRELVSARAAFLAAGYYDGFADEVSAAASLADDFIVDAGCGEGYYTLRAAKASGLAVCGFDLSKHAAGAAAKAAGRNGSDAFFGVAGIFDMPLADGCAGAVLNIFAPCAEAEFLRVLKDGGYLILAGAGEEHLYGLKRAVYDNPTKNTPRADLPRSMKLIQYKKIRYALSIKKHSDIEALFKMTPYYYRTGGEGFERLAQLDFVDTEVDIDLYIYKKEV